MRLGKAILHCGAVLVALQAVEVRGAPAQVRLEWHREPAAVREARLDSLEAVVLTATERKYSVDAVINIARCGYVTDSTGAPYCPGVVARLAALYQRTDGRTRWFIVRMMRFQLERKEAVAFLERVGRKPSRDAPPWHRDQVPDGSPLWWEVRQLLTHMDAEGEAALARLAASDSAP